MQSECSTCCCIIIPDSLILFLILFLIATKYQCVWKKLWNLSLCEWVLRKASWDPIISQLKVLSCHQLGVPVISLLFCHLCDLALTITPSCGQTPNSESSRERSKAFTLNSNSFARQTFREYNLLKWKGDQGKEAAPFYIERDKHLSP